LKNYLLILTFLICNCPAIFAQFEINSSFIPVPGNVEKIWNVYAKSLSSGPSGENQKWDFTDLIPLNDSTITTYVNPSFTPYGNNFPLSTVASSDLNKSNYSYYKITNSTYEVLGFGQTMGVLIYSKPMILMQYPLSYLQTFTNDFYGSGSNGGYTLNVNGNFSATCDAYGTISLPSGISDVMRIKTVSVYYDTLYFQGSIMSANFSTDTTFYWFKKEYKFTIFFISNSFSDGKSTKSAGYVVNSSSIDNSQLEIESY
jgi:hypothetical protein